MSDPNSMPPQNGLYISTAEEDWLDYQQAIAAQRIEALRRDEERAYAEQWLEDAENAPQMFKGRSVEAIVFFGSWEEIWEIRLRFYPTWDAPLEKLLANPSVERLKNFVSSEWRVDDWISGQVQQLEEICGDEPIRSLSMLMQLVEYERELLLHLLAVANHDVARGYSKCRNPGFHKQVESCVTALLNKLTGFQVSLRKIQAT